MIVHSRGRPCKAARTGFTQEQIAKWFQVTTTTVHRWETGVYSSPPGYSLELRLSGDWERITKVVCNYHDIKNARGQDVFQKGKVIHTDSEEFIHRNRPK